MTADGRIYYIDHNNQRTSWEKPRYITRQPTAEERGGKAPPTEQVKLSISSMHLVFYVSKSYSQQIHSEISLLSIQTSLNKSNIITHAGISILSTPFSTHVQCSSSRLDTLFLLLCTLGITSSPGSSQPFNVAR